MTDFILGVIVDYMPKFKLKIFLPAAGLGERMRPITNHIPKPLLPMLGKPLLEIILEKITKTSSGKIGINLHYKPEMVRQWVMNSAYADRVMLFPEDTILGTGGALKNAEEFLSDRHFLVHNTDIISDIDFSRLIETHLSHGNIATLATHNYSRYNNVVVNDNGYVIGIENTGTSKSDPNTIARKVAYTGVAVYSQEIFRFMPSGPSHATTAWLAAAKAGHKIQALDFTGCFWRDMGTPASYAATLIELLRAEGETVYIHPSVEGCSHADINGHIIIENRVTINKNVSLKNCIVLPETKIEEQTHYENCIIGPDFTIKLNEHEMMGSFKKNNKTLIGTGGSDRRYYRIWNSNQTTVLMQCTDNDPDFLRHIEYTKFLSRYSVPVPYLIDVNAYSMQAAFEDLGDISLYSWLKCNRDNRDIEMMYRKIMDVVVQIHTSATEHLSECPLLEKRFFDYEHFRWETGYFIERFVEGMKNIKIQNPNALYDEFHAMASSADSFKKTIIHRDFQSQNIMIKNVNPRLIDYQGMRIGPPAYDIASLLWDPYYRIENDTRERLLNYYLERIKAADKKTHNVIPRLDRGIQKTIDCPVKPDNDKYLFSSEEDFIDSLMLCRLQRHMQALGAYGFLSSVKGKKYFLKHITEGLRLLKKDLSLTKDKYPELNKLVMSL